MTINEGPERGGELIVRLRLEGSEELPFIEDAGYAVTVFDKSLERKLGKRFDSLEGRAAFGHKMELGVYAAPTVYWEASR